MNKNPFTSKTLWGAGIVALIFLGQSFGLGPDATWLEVVKVLAGSLGVYGLRDAIS